jgi:predicted permease
LGSRYSITTIRTNGVPERDTNFFSYPLYSDFRDHSEVFSDLAAMSTFTVRAIVGRDRPEAGGAVERARVRMVSGNFFDVLGIEAALGRMLLPRDGRKPGESPVAVVSHAFWSGRYEKSEDTVGRVIRLNETDYTIVGVAEPAFTGVTGGLPIDLWVPITMQPQLTRSTSDLADRNALWVRIFGRVKEGIAPSMATTRTNDLFHQLLRDEAGSEITPETNAEIQKLRTDIASFSRGFSVLRGRYSQPLVLLMVVVGLVLLIACANIGNMLLARASSRQREVVLRLSVGASRRRLLRQFFTESLVLALVGGALALLVAQWTIAFLLGLIFTQGAAPLDVSLDQRVLAFNLGISLLAALLFGLVPALRGTRLDLNSALKSSAAVATESRQGWSLRRLLVISQVAASIFLLTFAGLFLRSLGNLRNQELGFRPEGLYQIEIDPQGAGIPQKQLPGLYGLLMERIASLPEVEAASISYDGIFSGSRWVLDDPFVDGNPAPSDGVVVEASFITPGYFETIGASLIAGRSFDTRDRDGAPKVAIVNEAFARHYFAQQSPVGKRFGINGVESSRDIEIVGLASDFKWHDLRQAAPRLIFLPAAQDAKYLYCIGVRSSADPALLIPEVRRTISEVSPNLPIFGVTGMEFEIERSLRQEKMLSKLTTIFGVLALLLASIGLHGVLAYAVSQRTGEIGIRMALGARRGEVLWMILRGAIAWIAVGAAAGLAVALAAGRFVAGLLFSVVPADPIAVLSAAGVLIIVAGASAYWPAWRASRMDPLTALRYE